MKCNLLEIKCHFLCINLMFCDLRNLFDKATSYVSNENVIKAWREY